MVVSWLTNLARSLRGELPAETSHASSAVHKDRAESAAFWTNEGPPVRSLSPARVPPRVGSDRIQQVPDDGKSDLQSPLPVAALSQPATFGAGHSAMQSNVDRVDAGGIAAVEGSAMAQIDSSARVRQPVLAEASLVMDTVNAGSAAETAADSKAGMQLSWNAPKTTGANIATSWPRSDSSMGMQTAPLVQPDMFAAMTAVSNELVITATQATIAAEPVASAVDKLHTNLGNPSQLVGSVLMGEHGHVPSVPNVDLQTAHINIYRPSKVLGVKKHTGTTAANEKTAAKQRLNVSPSAARTATQNDSSHAVVQQYSTSMPRSFMRASSANSMFCLTTFVKQQQQQLWLQQYLTRTANSGANTSQLAPLQQHALYQLPHHRRMEYLLESQYLFKRSRHDCGRPWQRPGLELQGLHVNFAQQQQLHQQCARQLKPFAAVFVQEDDGTGSQDKMGSATPAAVLSLEGQPGNPPETAPSGHTVADEHGALMSQANNVGAQAQAAQDITLAETPCNATTTLGHGALQAPQLQLSLPQVREVPPVKLADEHRLGKRKPLPPPPVVQEQLPAHGSLRVLHQARSAANVHHERAAAVAHSAGMPRLSGKDVKAAASHSMRAANIQALAQACAPATKASKQQQKKARQRVNQKKAKMANHAIQAADAAEADPAKDGSAQDAQTLIGVHPQLTPVSSIKAGLPAKLQLTKQTSTAGVASHASVAAVPSSAVPSSSVPSSAVPCGAGNDSAPKVKGNTVLADSMPARLSDYGGLPVGLSDYGGMPAGLSDYGGMPASVGGKVKGSRLPRADSGRAIGKKARDAAAALLTSGSQSKGKAGGQAGSGYVGSNFKQTQHSSGAIPALHSKNEGDHCWPGSLRIPEPMNVKPVSPGAEVAAQLEAAGSVDVTAEELAANVTSNRHDQQRAQGWSKPPLRPSAVAAKATCNEKAAEHAWQVETQNKQWLEVVHNNPMNVEVDGNNNVRFPMFQVRDGVATIDLHGKKGTHFEPSQAAEAAVLYLRVLQQCLLTRIRCVKLIAGKGTGAQFNAVRNELAGLKAKRELVATVNNLPGRSANSGMVVTLLPKRA